jgi:DNA-binding PucR family transcriptional regulator
LGHRDPRIDQLCRELDQRGVTVVTAVNRSDGWALWTSSDTQPGANAARQLLRAVRVAAAATPEEWRLSIGIGRARRGPSGLTESLNEARDAADLGRSHEFRPAVEHSDELGVARLLATWQRSDVTRAFAETALSPLRETPQLLETLTAFLESGGSMVETAQVLRVHRNTVTHRMQQLRERLGVDLDDPSQRLALQVACRSLNN